VAAFRRPRQAVIGARFGDWVAVEPSLRLAAFALLATTLAWFEHAHPHRRPRPWRLRGANVALMAINTVVVRLVSASSLVALASHAHDRAWGLLPHAQLPAWVAAAVAIVVLDASLYAQHRLLHRSSILWRFHAVHHADVEFDFTTGVRFHPGEILVSFAWKAGVVVALGAPPVAVLLFETLLSSASLFSHANLRLGARSDRTLRRFIVTPNMHRIHHSTVRDEQDSNFGFLVVWWDRLLGTYRSTGRDESPTAAIGLAALRDRSAQTIWRLLLQPIGGAARERSNSGVH
jgi:sterol desaturase/sphingolipid hydroxylase (fatty acid hydroxylase superfamily)